MPTAELVTMSAHVLGKRLSQVEAGKKLGITPRQVRILIGRCHRDGAVGLVSRKRGKRSNNAYQKVLKSAVIELVSKDYYDFGSTLTPLKLQYLLLAAAR